MPVQLKEPQEPLLFPPVWSSAYVLCSSASRFETRTIMTVLFLINSLGVTVNPPADHG